MGTGALVWCLSYAFEIYIHTHNSSAGAVMFLQPVLRTIPSVGLVPVHLRYMRLI